jgi:hypothetical protein
MKKTFRKLCGRLLWCRNGSANFAGAFHRLETIAQSLRVVSKWFEALHYEIIKVSNMSEALCRQGLPFFK